MIENVSDLLGDLSVSDDDIDRLLAPSEDIVFDGSDISPSDELQVVSRRIAGQYVELIEGFAAGLFHRRPSAGLAQQLLAALDALVRLAGASGDSEAQTVTQDLQKELQDFVARQARGKGTERMGTKLRAWIPRFGALLEPAARERLLNLVSYRGQAIPLFNELGAIPGIGPRRLERLYCAGLYTVEAVVHADADEVAQVTGLPPALASRVLEATRAFAAEDRLRSARELQARTTEVLAALRLGEPDPEILGLAREALRALRNALDAHGQSAHNNPLESP